MVNFFEVNYNSIVEELKKGLKTTEINDEGFSEIGFSLRLFDEIGDISVVVSFNLGASHRHINNVCNVKVDGVVLNEFQKQQIVYLIQSIFNPTSFRII